MSEGPQSWNEARLRAIITAHSGREGPFLPILHAVQDAFGYIPQP